ncbi:MAG: ribbon-helix-helix protein, CopG family [Thermoleophilaceae bacterium]
MVRTTVYLEEHDLAALRRIAAETGRSQASIVRDAVAEAIKSGGERSFKSQGARRGTGEPIGPRSERIVREELGRRRR